MRILFLSTVYPGPGAPNLGLFNRSRIEALRSADEVRVVAPIPWPRALRLRVDRQEGRKLGGTTIHPTYFYPPKILQGWYGWFMWHSVRRAVLPVLQAFRPDAILAYWAHPDGEAALRAARAARVPVGLVVGGSDVLLLTRSTSRRRAVVRVLQGVDAVFPVGSALTAKASELGVPRGRLHELVQGVDAERFSPGDPQAARKRLGVEPGLPLLLFVGHLIPVKGLEVLLATAALLAARGLDFRLWVIGDGNQRGSLEKHAADIGVARQVRFLGPRPQEDLPDFFRAADLTVLSSHSEGVPNVLRESLACGTPFVATRVGGIADIATADCELVPPGDPQALADAIAGRLGRPLVKRPLAPHTWQESANTVRSVLSSLVEHQRLRR